MKMKRNGPGVSLAPLLGSVNDTRSSKGLRSSFFAGFVGPPLPLDPVRFIYLRLSIRQVKKYWSESRATSLRRYHTVVNWADASQGYLQLTGITAGPEVNWVNWSQEYLDLTGNDAGPDVIDTTTIYTKRPSGFVEFDVTDAVKNWRGGNPNYGVLLRATNEYTEGRDIRFYSNAHADKTKHAFINVLCE